MIFDKIIMNPPFNGRGNLYLKITSMAKKHCNQCVCLSPYTSYVSQVKKKYIIDDINYLQNYASNYEIISGKSFGVALDKKLCIFDFHNENNFNFDDLFFEDKFKDKSIAKIIFNKIRNYCKKDCLYNHLIIKNFNLHKYNCYIPGTRGNYNLKDDKCCWT